MKITKPLVVSALALLVLLISACSQTTTGGTPSSLSPSQVLQKSADAMKQLKSSHIVIQSTDNIQATAQSSGSNATPTASNINFTINGSGDQATVDQQQLNLNVSALNQNYALSEISLADKVYLKSQGQWYVVNKSDYQSAVTTNPFSGVTIDQNTLLGIIQDVKITDHSDQNLNGQNLRHITGDLDKTALKQLISQSPQLKSMFGTQDIDTLLNNTKSFLAQVDVWIDETNFYVHRTELKLNIAGNPAAATNNAVTSASTNLDTTVDLSNFNKPVTITAPANAQPIKDASSILGLNH